MQATNVGELLPDYTAQKPRRQPSSSLSLRHLFQTRLDARRFENLKSHKKKLLFRVENLIPEPATVLTGLSQLLPY
jgi:hypothetical protein